MIRLSPVSVVNASEGGSKPFATIDAADATQAIYWSFRLSVPRDELLDAIDKVGPSVAAVRRHLGK